MSNWTAITQDMLEAAGHSAIIGAAQSAGVGGVDPVAQAIAGAVASVRRAVSTGNDLDIDPTKVPNSLMQLTVSLAVYRLMIRIEYLFTKGQEEDNAFIGSELRRISDHQIRVESPDTPGGAGEMQSQPLPFIRPRRRRYSEQAEDGA